MKIKPNVNLNILVNLGFEEVVGETKKEYKNYYGDFDYNFENKYAFNLGHSRRGQFYYLLVDKDSREVYIYSTKPDGDGGELLLNNIFFKLLEIVEV